jgi:trans-2,3-dihydro-3-hydroxyanthranilate isomerase
LAPDQSAWYHIVVLLTDEMIGNSMKQRESYQYQVVDVFTPTLLEGNPLAVFCDAADLDSSTMHNIARELNVSETGFIVPPRRADCVARLRIFTPWREMDFAGHPTVGTAFVLIQQGPVSRESGNFCVEENVGAVPVAIDEKERSMLWLTTPPLKDGPTIDKSAAVAVISLPTSELADSPPQVLSAGNPTLFIALDSRSAVDKAALDGVKWAAVKGQYQLGPICVFVAPTPEGAYSRMFAPDYGVPDDPATGSSTGPLAGYMIRPGMASGKAGSRFISEQGTQMGRQSILHVRVHGKTARTASTWAVS